jgi:hypothetical protein
MSQKTGVGRARIGARYKIHDETAVKHPSEKSRFRPFAPFQEIMMMHLPMLQPPASTSN